MEDYIAKDIMCSVVSRSFKKDKFELACISSTLLSRNACLFHTSPLLTVSDDSLDSAVKQDSTSEEKKATFIHSVLIFFMGIEKMKF